MEDVIIQGPHGGVSLGQLARDREIQRLYTAHCADWAASLHSDHRAKQSAAYAAIDDPQAPPGLVCSGRLA